MAAGLKAGTAYVDILPRVANGFGNKIEADMKGEAEKAGASTGSAMGGALGGAAILAVGALGVRLFKGFIDGARESQEVAAQTANVIKSTGGAANITAGEVDKLSGAISRKTGIDDEAIGKAANLLLTFTNLKNGVGAGNDIFNQATKTVTDMAAALGGDASSNAIQLGKALNDPVAGISALTRVGVTFTDQQKEQIKTLVKTGDTMGAQKLILAELNKEFGGSAEAQATAGKKLSVTWGNLQEQLGTAMIPILDKLATALNVVLGWFSDLSPGTQTAIIAVAGLGAALVGGALIVGKLSDAMAGLKVITESETLATIAHGIATAASTVATAAWTAAQWLLNAALDANPIGLIIVGVAALAAGIIYAYQHSETFRNIIEALWKGIQVAAGVVVDFGQTIIRIIGGAIDWARDHWQLILAILTGPVGLAVLFVKDHLDQIVGFFTGMPGRLKSVAGDLFGFMRDAFRAAINWIIDGWNGLQFKLPKVDLGPLGKLGGETIGVPNLPHLATGGRVVGAGLAVVGEQGPEIVRLPAGAEVVPNGAGKTYQVLFTGPVHEPVNVIEQFRRMELLAP